jgi:hypothetical protein
MADYTSKGKKKFLIILWLVVFLLYALLAVQPVPRETELDARWIASLETGRLEPVNPVSGGAGGSGSTETTLIPFELGARFGYVDRAGQFSLLETRATNISLSAARWAAYDKMPQTLDIRSSLNESLLTIDNAALQGYPFFPDKDGGRVFIVSREQNSLSFIGDDGLPLWSYDFAAPLTCVDAAAGLLLAGTLDGAITVLDASGARVFFFEPSGSRIAVITGCAISEDGLRLALISGLDDQRFLLLEKFGDSYRVTYHEFLGDGFRRPVYVDFVDTDRRVAFERGGGLGLYDIARRTSLTVPLLGSVVAADRNGDAGLLFIVCSVKAQHNAAAEKRFYAIRYPGNIVLNAPFYADNVFLGREGNMVFVGGDNALASFEIVDR